MAQLRHRVGAWRAFARGRAWCLRFGMTASSWDGWAKMHVNPFVAMRFFFLSAACDVLTQAYVSTSLPMHRSMLLYVVTFPHLLQLVITLTVLCAMFRKGPQIVFHSMYPPVILLVVLLGLPACYLGYIGPLDTVPWNSRLKFSVVTSINLAFKHLSAAAGALPGEHPSEPRTSISKPVFRAFIQTFRVIDSITDLSLIGELLTEVRC